MENYEKWKLGINYKINYKTNRKIHNQQRHDNFYKKKCQS